MENKVNLKIGEINRIKQNKVFTFLDLINILSQFKPNTEIIFSVLNGGSLENEQNFDFIYELDYGSREDEYEDNYTLTIISELQD
jgi:hypothetical protein